MVALIFALISVLLTFGSEVVEHKPSGESGATVKGDLLAVATGVVTSCFICVVRAAEQTSPLVNMQPTPAIGAAMLFTGLGAVMSVNGQSFQPEDDGEMSAAVWFALVFVDAVCVSLILVAFTLAPKTLSGAEVSLISLLEVVFGPIIVFLVLGDVPGPWTLAGGGLLLATLALHEISGMPLSAPHSELLLPAGEQSDELAFSAESLPLPKLERP